MRRFQPEEAYEKVAATDLAEGWAMDEQQKPATATRHRIEIKLSAEQKDLIVRGAASARQGISEFVRTAAERAALEVLNKK